jgi:hypothetical protein
MNLVSDLAQAIARFEGFYNSENTLAKRNNNPGNLRSWGSNPISEGYAKFPTVEAGWAALHRQIQLNIDRGLNLYEFFAGKGLVYAGYAPATDNNKPVHYAQTVAGWIGIDPTVKLASYQQGGTSPPLDQPSG